MSAILNGHWRPVTQQNPCPACGKPDWCAFSADGAVLRCMRDGSAPGGMQLLRHDGSGGTLFKINKAPVQNGAARYTRKNSKSAKTSPETKSVNLDELANRFAASLTPRHRTDLTVALGVPESTLDALACGWCDVDDLRMMGAGGAGWSDDPPAGAYSFPERAGDGRLVGFSLRTLDGRKGSPSRSIGASRGLVIPKELQDAPGPVIIVEGASDVAAALALGLVAVGRPSNVGGAADLARLLESRNIIVVGENDAKATGAWPGRDGAIRIATQLATKWGTPVRWTLPPLGTKDIRAWLTARVDGGLDLADVESCRSAGTELFHALQSAAKPTEPEKQPSMAESIVQIAKELYRFGRTDKDEVFAVAQAGPNLAIQFRGARVALRATLAREFYRRTSKTPSSTALTDALTVLTGEAYSANPESVALRVAKYDSAIVLDLGDASGRAVIVRGAGWEVVDRSPVLFHRTALTASLPVPERGGNLSELRDLFNITNESWPILLGWLISALFPEIPHPILLLSGTQGTGKTTAARILVSLFDPSGAPLRSEPRDVEQWAISAAGSWGVALDNLSSIPCWLSDALCKAVTGDGWVRRALYTDGDLAVLAYRRVVLLTSIDAGALRGDLGERLLLIDLEPIVPTTRRTEEDLERRFADQRPRLLGAILDALAAVLAKLPTVKLESMPRMADFARILAALDSTCIIDERALNIYLSQNNRVAAEVIDDDPFALAIIHLIADCGRWKGTAGDLSKEIRPEKPIRGWPTTGVAVRGRLKRLVPALATQGVIVRFPMARTRRGRLIEIDDACAQQSQLSQQSHCPTEVRENQLSACDTLDDCPSPGDEVALPTSTEELAENRGKTTHGVCGDCCDSQSPPLSRGTDDDNSGTT